MTVMSIAGSSCHLKHVARGVEMWARDTRDCLCARRMDVHLFKASDAERRIRGEAVAIENMHPVAIRDGT